MHTELFHADATPPAPAAPTAPSTHRARAPRSRSLLDGRRSTVRLPADGVPVLDAALQVRADAPFSCRGGVCGTCRAKVLEGSVRMDHTYALEPDEIARGYVLTCQSHPTSDRVVLDFDV